MSYFLSSETRILMRNSAYGKERHNIHDIHNIDQKRISEYIFSEYCCLKE